jgi:hypothetical protein
MPVLQIIVADTHMGQPGQPVAQWFGERAREHGGFDVRLVNLAETDLDAATVDAAEAFVFVVPDKGANAASNIVTDAGDLQWLYKPLGVISYGSHESEAQAISEVLALLGMTRIDQSIAIESGKFIATEALDVSAKAMLDELWCLNPFLDALRAWAATSQLA